jgi:hypothetical protein
MSNFVIDSLFLAHKPLSESSLFNSLGKRDCLPSINLFRVLTNLLSADATVLPFESPCTSCFLFHSFACYRQCLIYKTLLQPQFASNAGNTFYCTVQRPASNRSSLIVVYFSIWLIWFVIGSNSANHAIHKSFRPVTVSALSPPIWLQVIWKRRLINNQTASSMFHPNNS